MSAGPVPNHIRFALRSISHLAVGDGIAAGVERNPAGRVVVQPVAAHGVRAKQAESVAVHNKVNLERLVVDRLPRG